MEDLKQLVKKLVKETDHDKQIRILQEINKTILTKYCIKVGDVKIRPLRLETYYFHPGKFEDSTVHRNRQQRRSEVLYRHNDKVIDLEKNSGGVDLCLAYSEKDLAPFYLSLLIKNSWVKTTDYEKNCKQIELNKILNEAEITDDTPVEFVTPDGVPEEDLTVFHTVRVLDSVKNLETNPFAKKCLASLIDINRKNTHGESIFDWANGFGKQWTVAEYMRCHPEKDRRNQCKKLIGYNSSEVINILKEMENVQ